MAKPPINTNLVVMPCGCPCSVGVDPCNCNRASVGVQCRSRSGTYSIIGFNTFLNLGGLPPKRFRTGLYSGTITISYHSQAGQVYDCSGPVTVQGTTSISGAWRYDRITTALVGNPSAISNGISYPVGLPRPEDGVALPSYAGYCANPTYGVRTMAVTSTAECISADHKCTGSLTFTLADEDTESDAIARAARSVAWSDWRSVSGGNACCASRSMRGAHQFSGAWTEAEIKLTAKGAPHATATVEITLVQRPLAGGAATKWTFQESVYCDSAGNGESTISLPAAAGYETCYSGIKQIS